MALFLIPTGCLLCFNCVHFQQVLIRKDMYYKVKSSPLDLNIRRLSLCRSELGLGSHADFQGGLQNYRTSNHKMLS